MNTSVVESGLAGDMFPVGENLTAKGAQKKRGKPGHGKHVSKSLKSWRGIKKFFHHAGKEIEKGFKHAGKEIEKGGKSFWKHEGKDIIKGGESIWKHATAPLNKVGNRVFAAWDDFSGYAGKDSMADTKQTQQGGTDWTTYLMWGGLAAGGVLIFVLIKNASKVEPVAALRYRYPAPMMGQNVSPMGVGQTMVPGMRMMPMPRY